MKGKPVTDAEIRSAYGRSFEHELRQLITKNLGNTGHSEMMKRLARVARWAARLKAPAGKE